MSNFTARVLSCKLFSPALAALLLVTIHPARAADDPDAPKGAAVTVLKAAKTCFANVVEVSGIVIAREESAVRPERQGLKVAEVLADPGDTVTASQTLARLNLPEGGSVNVQAPVAGVISASTATVGAMASGRGEALFNIIARSEYDLVGLVPTEDLPKLAAKQLAAIHIVGAGDVQGIVRRVGPTVEPNSQLGQVFIAITTNRRLLVNSSGRAIITIDQSYGAAGAAHGRALRHRRRRGPGGQARPGRDQVGRGRADVRRPSRDQERADRGRRRGGARGGAIARGRSGAADHGGQGRELAGGGCARLARRVALHLAPLAGGGGTGRADANSLVRCLGDGGGWTPSPACGGGPGWGCLRRCAGQEDRLSPTRRALSSAIAEAQLRRSILDGRRRRPMLPRKRERCTAFAARLLRFARNDD